MFQVHEEGHDEISLDNGQHDKGDHENGLGNWGECNSNFEDRDEKKNPERSPDNSLVLGIVMLLNELVVDIAGVVPVGFVL